MKYPDINHATKAEKKWTLCIIMKLYLNLSVVQGNDDGSVYIYIYKEDWYR